MTPAGLPGFLRRSIRTLDDVDSVDEYDNDGDDHMHINGSVSVGDVSSGVEDLSISGVSGVPVPLPPSVSSPNAAGQKKMPRVGVSEIYQQSMATRKSGSGSGSGSGGNESFTTSSGDANIGIGSKSGSTGNAGNAGNPRWNETPPSSVNAKFRMVATRGSGRDKNGDTNDNDSNHNENGNGNTNGEMQRKQINQKLNQPQNILNGDEKGTDTASSANGENGNDNTNTFASTDPPTTSTMSNSSSTEEKSGNNDNDATTATRKPQEKSQQPPTQTPRPKNYKEIEFDKVISAPVVNIADLRRLAWNGIPPHHRPQAWKMLLGYLPTNTARRAQTLKRKRNEYKDAILQHYDIDDHSRTLQEQETLRQVLVDVPRTAPDVPLFRNDKIRQSLSRLLYIWAMRHPASSYVQGINDLATPLVAVFLSEYFNDGNDSGSGSDSSSSVAGTAENTTTSILDAEQLDLELTQEILSNVEADVYWCLTNLLAGIQDHYTSDQPGVQRMVMRLEELVTRMDVGLTQHLESTGVMFMQFAFRWMNCLLLREFNLKCIIRLWDTYLSEGDGGFETFHVYVCAAFICQFSGQLQGMQFDELFAFMQNIPTSDWGDSEVEIVLSQAFVLSTLFHGSDAHLTSASPRI